LAEGTSFIILNCNSSVAALSEIKKEKEKGKEVKKKKEKAAPKKEKNN